MVIISWTVSYSAVDSLTFFVRALAGNVGMRVYLEATADSCVEARNLAEDVLVGFPLAIPTDGGEVREVSALEGS